MLSSDISSSASMPSSPEASDPTLQTESANAPNKEKVSKHRPSYFTPKIKFSPHEDMLLLHAVQSLGTGDWHIIASRVPGRNARQCRERWNNYVNPSLISAPWTPEEDRFLMEKYQELGAHWRTIASYFSSRSTNSIKNRFTILQRRQRKKANRKSKEKQQTSKTSTSNSKSASHQIGTSNSSVSVFPSNGLVYFSPSSNFAAPSSTSSPSDSNIDSNIYNDFISIEDNTTQKKNEEISMTKKEEDPLHFLDSLKDIDNIFWTNEFDDPSFNWFDVNYF